MPKLSPTVLSLGLLGAGVAVWALATPPLVARPDAKIPLNPLGINSSPYGEVFAMAMQSPIDAYWHGAEADGHVHTEHCNHDHEDDHVHGEHCKHGDEADSESAQTASASTQPSIHIQFRNFLSALSKLPDKRTNPLPASEAQKRYMRRGAEDKLRFAYRLDPAHYGNYNSLHFFLTEPSIGTRPELTPSAAKLAQETIDYCLKQENDPRPALTAAAACTNILHLMFTDQHKETPKYTTQQMRQCLAVLDHCIRRYIKISKQWDEAKQWELLSPQRVAECEERFSFITKIRDDAEGAIARFEGKPLPSQVSN